MKNGKRCIAILLAMMMLMSAVPTALAAQVFSPVKTYTAGQFSDVETGQWYESSVQTAYELGLMSGDAEGTFRPSGQVTLAETVTVAARIHALATAGEEHFVQGSPWYQVYVDYALEKGILSAALSDYAKAATRLEFAQILAKALPAENLFAINHVEEGAIPDVTDEESVYLLYRAGVLTGSDSKGTFLPESNIQRCEVAAIVSRMAVPELRQLVTLDKPEAVLVADTSKDTEKENDRVIIRDDREDKEENVQAAVPSKPEYVDENNALTKPFDEVYPDLFASGEVEYSGEHILIKLEKAPSGRLSKKLKDAGVTYLEEMYKLTKAVWYKAQVDRDVQEVMEAVRQIPDVLVAEYDYAYSASSIADAEEISSEVLGNGQVQNQWYLKSCGVQSAWKSYNHGANTVVAVIDTGVDYSHEDLKDNMWVNEDEIPENGIDDDENGYVDDYLGFNAIANNGNKNAFIGDPMDDNGHGTHVAGIIAGRNNNMGIVGIAYEAKVMAIKAGMSSGYFLHSDIAEAVLYAAANGADVINMSFGGNASSIAVQDALAEAYTHSVLVASAGNGEKPNEPTDHYQIDYAPTYPAALSYVLGVMSVGSGGVESTFTNWDASAYNSVEYEVYAPGEQILSTIPGNKYASWNGTSMAAPVVSAMAAILKHEYPDQPTKFICGQLVNTSERSAICVNPEKHTVGGDPHNLPKIVDLYAALTEMPSPEVSVYDWYISDAADLNEENSEDGVIDAGETIALAFALRNRWGKSTDTQVTIDVLAHDAYEDPYVTILEPTIDYGEIGTYSTSDGKAQLEEAPFLLQIDEDCPNDYIIALNVTVTCKNALDEADEKLYSGGSSITLKVRKGEVLEGTIKDDTTLDPEKYYIIPSGLKVAAGATLTVLPGTQIQFWAADPEDYYADNGIAILNVEGTLLCEGTEENPVEIFPSDLMSEYQVDIHTSGSGVVRMEHTRVVNPYFDITYAKNCEFTQNYQGGKLYYRSLSGSVVDDSYHPMQILIDYAEGCAFDRCGAGGRMIGSYKSCIFVDCAFDFSKSKSVVGTFDSCVFYGNNNAFAEKKGETSAITALQPGSLAFSDMVTDPSTGKVYIKFVETPKVTYSYIHQNSALERFAEVLGGTLLCINTAEESAFLGKNNMQVGVIGLQRDLSTGNLIWADGSPVDETLLSNYEFPTDSSWGRCKNISYQGYVIVELPAEHVSGIQLDKYEVTIDTESFWQIDATSQPFDLFTDELIYESMDEAVAVVDNDGLVEPVGLGDTVIRVYAPDYYLWRELTVHVVESKPLESIDVDEDLRMNVGDEKVLIPTLTPADTSQSYLLYESSDENVATISRSGVITALRDGETVITVTSAHNPEIVVQVTIQVVIPAEQVVAEEAIVLFSKEGETWAEELGVTVLPEDTTDKTLIWESSNPEIAYVDNETGELVKVNYGNTTLRATATDSDEYVEIVVCIPETIPAATVVQMQQVDNYFVALLSDGTMWRWGETISTPLKMEGFSEVKQFGFASARYLMVLTTDGQMQYYDSGYSDSETSFQKHPGEPKKTLSGVKQIACIDPNTSGGQPSYYSLREDGGLWVWGYNYYGQLAIDTNGEPIYQITQVDLNDKKIVEIACEDSQIYLLDDTGNVWVAGISNMQSHPELSLFATGVVHIAESVLRGSYIVCETNETIYTVNSNSSILKQGVHDFYNGYNHAYIDKNKDLYTNGRINTYGQSGVGTTTTFNDYRKVLKVQNVANVYWGSNTNFIQTEDRKFYSVGYNNNNQLGNLTQGHSSIPKRVYFGMEINETAPVLEANTCIDGIWTLDFDQALAASSKYVSVTVSDSAGNLQSIRKTIYLDKLLIEPYSGWTEGETYTLTIPANALQNKFSVAVEAQTVTFTAGETTEPVEEEDVELQLLEETAAETTYYDETIQRHVWTKEEVMEAWNTFKEKGFNTEFWNNAILNRLNDSEVAKWLRITASSGSGIIGMGGNYWGTTDKTMIERQLLDVTDNVNLYDLNPGEYLTEIPEELWPTITEAGLLNQDDQPVDVVGPETLTFYVEFNRDMDQSIPLDVRFGSHEPYADYQVEGEWKTARRWEGTMTLNTFVEAGIQYWCVDNGKAADSWQKLYKDWGRFQFTIDTTDALAMNLFANPTENGVELSWNQDDFDTLAGYNVYRSTQENGLYERLNDTIIPVGEEYFLDDTVYPSTLYYYIFTVVQTGGQMGDAEPESMPSGKVSVMTMDTLAPDMIHSPVRSGYEGSSITVTALVSDEREVQGVKLYYRIAGTDAWNVSEMSLLNNKYTSIIQYNYVTTAGVEYYIEAWDGSNYTYKGSSDAPYVITVYEALDQNAMGDVNGDGQITILDALMMLQAINGYIPSLTDEQFKRADLNGNENLEAAEVFTILRYVNGEIGSVTMQ